ncbi:Type 1 glutamine amidotransferase-like domain-containing protein [Planomicrobium sp. MB-3u-38]|uniref:Type 1 glutamine amidotransferase-like domain-containing protein n=1 Tax=Planomicrobium sp. MB-3u-38 TaxID=2058318 RepID=UPI0018ED7E21|nr:Type 1 glutamine amidotransferase-like domain-containing protein [Planomicrobium sp. MB-3u-38]
MKIHYYLGWFTEYFPVKLEKSLKEDIMERKSLVMISSMPAADDNIGTTERSWLNHADIKFDEYHLINYRVQKEHAQSLIQNASAIFLLGGDTVEQNAFIKEYGLADAIRQSDAVVLGASAGAINMSAKWLCSRNFGYDVEESNLYEGIGLGNFSVLSHFDLENNMEMVRSELALLSEELPVYASNKDCALRVKGDHLDILGDVYLIARSEIKKLDETL